LRLRLAENFRAIFYAPFYALKVLGFAADAGLEIDWLESNIPGGTIDSLKSGVIDVTWGGPMRVIKDHDSTPRNGASLVCFGEVVARDPFYLVGRPAHGDFKLEDLATMRLGVVSEVPTPWLCLQDDLRQAGLDPLAIQYNTSRGMPQNIEALGRGALDAAQCFEPYVSQALATGAVQIIYAAHSRGPTVYTTFISTRDGMLRHREAFIRLQHALRKVQDWIAANGPAALAETVSPFFPDIPAAIFSEAIERYAGDGIWASSPPVSRSGFDRLAHSLHAGGFVSRLMTYEECVDDFDDRKAASGRDQNQ
jgi:NitT/TauT family transport system substrate-binding protein